MAQFTLGQAAKRLGVSKPTLSKHIRLGRLSAAKLESGAFAIDAAELARFEASYRKPVAVEVKPEAAPAAEVDAAALAVAQERARQLEERLEEARAALAKAEEAAATARAEAAAALVKEREAWQRVAGLLEGPKPARGWWARITGG